MITFKEFFTHQLLEAKEGDRIGIKHLYSHNKPELYSMDFSSFKLFVDYLQQNGNKIDPSNSSVSEKVDGMALKIGNDDSGNFFMQSSYSGKVYNTEDFLTAIKFPPAQQAFMDGFHKLKKILNQVAANVPCTIQLEWLYSPNATKIEERPSMVSFVTAGYNISKLGTWSTFVVLNIEGDNLDSNKIKSSLIKLSTKEIKFISPDVEVFKSIDLTGESRKAQLVINKIEKLQIPQEIEQLKGNRKRDAIGKRKQLEGQLSELILPIQQQMYEKIATNLIKTEGILGDIEGYVIKAGDLMFKVNNPEFMKAKFEL